MLDGLSRSLNEPSLHTGFAAFQTFALGSAPLVQRVMMKVDKQSVDDKADSKPEARFQYSLEPRCHGLDDTLCD